MPSKEYLEGSMRAYEEDAEVSTPGPFSNPYDPWFPLRAADFEEGYNDAKADLKKRRKAGFPPA
jgi:hypothetical protein